MNVVAIVPAAGKGARMGCAGKKPYMLLDNRPVLSYVLEVLENTSVVKQVIVAVSPGDENTCKNDVIKIFGFKKADTIIPGGNTRQDSVSNALSFVSENTDMVLIHDSVRPLIVQHMIEECIKATKQWKATAMGVPVKDTIKIVNSKSIIKATPRRDDLWLIQTPQTFEKDIILRAYIKAYQDGFVGTDDASLVERLGCAVRVIIGSYENIKITTKEDIFVAEALLKKRKKTTNESWHRI